MYEVVENQGNEMRLSAKTAIVSGTGTGLGRAIALRFAQEGANVVAVDLVGAAATANEIRAAGGQSVAFETDISSEQSVSAMIDGAIKGFGTVDILVNAAALASTLKPKPFEELSVSEWQQVLNVNVVGTFLMCRSVAPIMRAKKSGRIINFSSGTTLRGAPDLLHYVASKGAVGSMTLSLANELGSDGITVNAIAPGYILTENVISNKAMSDQIAEMVVNRRAIKRHGTPDDVVGAAVFLASDDAAFISSQMLVVNGGLP
jgi:NAD(P)-dependent dehydrogenase (short-subunit alcohol dehydrogenase family)